MKKKRRLKKWVKKALLIIILMLISSFTFNFSYARYVSETNGESEIGVAKYGTLTLVEKLNDEIQQNEQELSAKIVETNLVLGESIDKEVYIEYIDSKVSTYLFLVIEAENWIYNDDLKEFGIYNNGSRLLYFNVNEIWNYVENLSNENKFIFYYDYDVLTDNNTTFAVMDQINVGLISYYDADFINNSQIKFNAYSIQKDDELSIEEIWNYLNIE